MDIYIPTKELILPVSVKPRVAGFIGWEVCKSGTGKVVRESPKQKNMITNAGLNRWADTPLTTMTTRLEVGSGTSEPSPTDTALQNLVAWTTGRTQTDISLQTSALPYYGSTTWEWEFGEGEAAGNLSELGFRSSSAPTALFSRQLFRDEFGQPTTITVLPDEFLRVTYELRKYAPDPVDNVEEGIIISGNEYTVTTRPASMLQVAGSVGDTWTSRPPAGQSRSATNSDPAVLSNSDLASFDVQLNVSSTGASTNDGGSRAAYTSGSLRNEVEYFWNPGTRTGENRRVIWGTGGATSGAGNHAQWQTQFDPPFVKGEDDRVTLQFYAEWDRL